MMAPATEMTTQRHHPVDRAVREFHVSRRVRDACGLSDTLFSVTGNVVFADFRAARELAHRLNEQRDVHNHPERAVRASRLYALGLIDEVLHLMVARHRQLRAPRLWTQVVSLLSRDLGAGRLDRVLETFVDEFPPTAVYRGDIGADAYLAGATDGVAHREIVIEELVLLWLANRNPAFADFRELFDDAALRRDTDYEEALTHIETILGGSATGEGASAAGGVGGETLLDQVVRADAGCTDLARGPVGLHPVDLGGAARPRSPPGPREPRFPHRRTTGVLSAGAAAPVRDHSSPRTMQRFTTRSRTTPPISTGCRGWCCWRRTPTSGSPS